MTVRRLCRWDGVAGRRRDDGNPDAGFNGKRFSRFSPPFSTVPPGTATAAVATAATTALLGDFPPTDYEYRQTGRYRRRRPR